jgi:hypothetical protein
MTNARSGARATRKETSVRIGLVGFKGPWESYPNVRTVEKVELIPDLSNPGRPFDDHELVSVDIIFIHQRARLLGALPQLQYVAKVLHLSRGHKPPIGTELYFNLATDNPLPVINRVIGDPHFIGNLIAHGYAKSLDDIG